MIELTPSITNATNFKIYISFANGIPIITSSSVCSTPRHSNLKSVNVVEKLLWALERSEEKIYTYVNNNMYHNHMSHKIIYHNCNGKSVDMSRGQSLARIKHVINFICD